MNLSQQYLTHIKNAGDIDSLAQLSGQFLNEQLSLTDFVIIKHLIHPDPYHIIFSKYDSFQIDQWQDDFLKFSGSIKPYTDICFNKNYYYFFDALYSKQDSVFLLCKDKLPDEALQLLKLWDQLNSLIIYTRRQAENKVMKAQANLLSQLMHDLGAIISLSEKIEKNEELQKRTAYQRQVNKNLLFFIRDIELLKSTVSIRQLISASLSLINLDNKISLMITDKMTDITVDVELFSKAFIEIVQNAIKAVQNDLSKIEINVDTLKSKTPLFSGDWIKFEVVDKGNGISDDFLQLTVEPFFTTSKSEGSSGFGLSTAKKIVEAHQGYMEIQSKQGSGTQVIIYLPNIE